MRQILIDHGAEFDTIDVDLLPGEERRVFMEAMRPHNPKMAFPVTIVGGKAIIGFQKELVLQELGVAG
jgi:glutaredoxin